MGIAIPSQQIQTLSWTEFLESFDWRQGEHITMIGPTGVGKTTLGLALLPRRRFPLVLATKPQDPAISALKNEGYWIVREWPPPPVERVVFWPRIREPSDAPKQREALRVALNDVFRSGGRAIYLDEVRYFTQTLGLKSLVELLWLQGRSLRISIVAGTQRPRHIPLEAYDMATHLFLWRDSDAHNLRRLAEIGGVNSKQLAHIVMHLPKHRFVYVNTRTGEMVESQVEI